MSEPVASLEDKRESGILKALENATKEHENYNNVIVIGSTVHPDGMVSASLNHSGGNRYALVGLLMDVVHTLLSPDETE